MVVAAPFDRETFNNTVHYWFSDSTGIDTMWANQSASQMPYPYARLMILSPAHGLSDSWDELQETDLTRDNGKEIKKTHFVQCSIAVSCQVLVGGDDSRNPSYNAGAYLNMAQAGLQLDKYLSKFDEANISIVNADQPQSIPSVIAGSTVDREGMTVHFGGLMSVEEYAGYIKTVEIEIPPLGIDDTFGDLS